MYINYWCVEPRMRLSFTFCFEKARACTPVAWKHTSLIPFTINEISEEPEQALDSGTGEWGRELELPFPPSPPPWVDSELTGFTYMLDLPGAVRENFQYGGPTCAHLRMAGVDILLMKKKILKHVSGVV